MPIVSVITRTKNRPILLKRAIESVSQQTFRDFRQIIINDGGAREIVDQAISNFTAEIRNNIVVVHNTTSLGMEAATNLGIREIDSEFIVIHDDDDSWEPTFLEATVKNIGMAKGIVTLANLVTEEIVGENVKTISKAPYRYNPEQITLFKMAMENQFPPIAFLFRRDVLLKIGAFDESLPVLGDWEFNLRFLRYYDIELLPSLLANYHIRKSTDDYGNTVTASSYLHRAVRARLNNKFLREDLDIGRFGLGTLVNLGQEIFNTNERLLIKTSRQPLKKIFRAISRIF